MPRSQCESDNVQFVQELAEVDGPFESPININFRDLTKLELPSLVWNRGDTCPKKMKITNTGHTVIISGKWKCERPYLTGGPLTGKYVFSQIHFHWGQNDCKGSEHQVCGDGFPLEMHVAHFKTEYSTQECALREKDGMAVVVYLFKLQEEPNQNLKKIINLLPCIKQASTSHAVDPRPILTFCKPFTDDYFMYWGSVVTSTCAHILLWIICREPFGISREQVNEFRKIMDSTQQPICRNSRDIQPLHKRNVFHVNASKHLENPLLPIKNIMACFCSGEEKQDTESVNCPCQANLPNQENVEGSIIEYSTGNECLITEGINALNLKEKLPGKCFGNQAIYVQRATVSVLLKRFDSEPVSNKSYVEKSFENNDERVVNLATKSCCFFPLNELSEAKTKKKQQQKRPFNSLRGFSQIIHSLEVLKNHTIRKLKEIESINQEIKGMKTFCQSNEDRRWLGNLEKMMRKQKRLTIKSSQGCFSELRKIAKDCNLGNVFHAKTLTCGDNNGKAIQWLYNDEVPKENLPSKQLEIPNQGVVATVKHLTVTKDMEISEKVQKLIQSFFEDIQESDDLNETVKKDLQLKKMKSLCSKEAGDSNSVSSVIKGYITQNMFILGNLGDRFFKEVTADEFDINEKEKFEVIETKIMSKNYQEEDKTAGLERIKPAKMSKDSLSTVQEGNVTVLLSKTSVHASETVETLVFNSVCFSDEEKPKLVTDVLDFTTKKTKNAAPIKKPQILCTKLVHQKKKVYNDSTYEKLLRNVIESKAKVSNVHRSASIPSTESNETQRNYAIKLRGRPWRNDPWGRNSSMSICDKGLQGNYKDKKNGKMKKRKKLKSEKSKKSSSSREELKISFKRSKWKNLTKAKFHLKIGSDSSLASEIESLIISPRKKKLKLGSYMGSSSSPRENFQIHPDDLENRVVIKYKRDESETDSKNLIKPKFLAGHSSRNEFDLCQGLSVEELKNISQISFTGSYRSTSGDSKTNQRGGKKGANELEMASRSPQIGNEILRSEISRIPVIKNRSLESLMSCKYSKGNPIFKESLSSIRKDNKEASQPKSTKKIEQRFTQQKDLDEIYKTDEECRQTNRGPENEENVDNLQYNIGFFTTSTQMDKELLPKCQIQEVTNKSTVLKRCDADKYQFFDAKVPEQLNPHPDGDEEQVNIVQQAESLIKDASKGDANPVKINKDLQTSVSYFQVKKNPTSRPHSAETLHSLTKTSKRKSKKRPHCCKRNSKHYIRKNSSIFRKPNKTESRSLNFLNLTEEEQLKIISVNVAKYLQEKLEKEKNYNSEKTYSTNNIETILAKLKPSQEEIKEKPPAKPVVQKQIQPPLKATEKPKKKPQQLVGKTKQKPLKSPGEPEKPVGSLQDKPKAVNNFIKLNKEMAGKYKKRWMPLPKKPGELKEKEKPLDTDKKIERSKFKTKIPKILIQKRPSQKPPEEQKPKPSPLRNRNVSPAKIPVKDTRTNNSRKVRKKDKIELLPTLPASTSNDETKGGACENKMSSLTFQKRSPDNKYFHPTTMVTSYLPSSLEFVENPKRKVSRYLLGMSNGSFDGYLPEVMYDSKSNAKDGNENFFKRELEYFIKLQLFLNKEISTNLEIPTSYQKSNLAQDQIVEITSVNEAQWSDLCNEGVTKSKDSNTRLTPEVEVPEIGDENQDKDKKQTADAIPLVSPIQEGKDESNSESSYECKISITFNADFPEGVSVEKEKSETPKEIPFLEPGGEEKNPKDDPVPCQEKTNQTTLQYIRKRKEEISPEMKRKLLEIFEGEIKKEAGIKCEGSSENSSDGLTFKLEDSDGNNRSPESSCDNIEILTQISDTMRQYLRDLKEKGQLVDLISESLNKKTKNSNAS